MLLDLMFGFTKQWSHSCAIPGWLILAIAAVFLLCFWLGLFRWALKDHHEKATQLPKSWKWWEIGACLLTAAIIWWILWYFEAIESWTYPEAFLVMLIVGLGLLMKLVIGNILLAGLSTGPYRLQEVYERTYFNVEYGYLLGWGLSFCLFGSLPWINTLLAFLATDNTGLWKTITATGTIGSLSTAIGWTIRNRKGEFSAVVTFFLRLGLTLIVLALAVGLYRAAIDIHADRISPYILLWVFLSLALAAKADFNFVSVHRYYADRLCLAYLGAPQSQEDASDFAIKNVNVRESGAPYPIINCTVLTPHSTDDDTRYRLRRGDNFIFSPLYFGANCTGYGNNKLGYRLSTAMAVSGAAIDPHTGEATTWELDFS